MFYLQRRTDCLESDEIQYGGIHKFIKICHSEWIVKPVFVTPIESID